MADIIERLRIESRREPHEPIWRDAIAEIEVLREEVAFERNLNDDAIHACISANIHAEQLTEALRLAREYVVRELAAEHDKFAIYEHYSNIESIEADLAKINAALSKESPHD